MVYLNFLKNILQLVLSPGSAWEDISAENTRSDRYTARPLWVFVAVASLAALLQLLYHPDQSVIMLCVEAIVLFSSYFIGYYLALLVFDALMAKVVTGGNVNRFKVKVMTTYIIGLMALWTLIKNAMPVQPALFYLVLGAILLVYWKSDKYIGVAQGRAAEFLLLGLLALIIPPVVIQEVILSLIF